MPTYWLNARIVVPQDVQTMPMGEVQRLDLFNLWVIRNHTLENPCDAIDMRRYVHVMLSEMVGHSLCPADGRWSLDNRPTERDPLEMVIGANHYD